jgi:succinyl-diaminopimelate desuccinylase
MVMSHVKAILERYPSVCVEEINFTEPAACDPQHEMVRFLQANARAISGISPLPVISLGGSDARLWRQRGIPAFIYGPYPRGMGQRDENVDVEEYLNVVKVHAASAFDYLSRPTP